jgi:regulator of nucleoside diphosphate kinase
MTDTFISSDKPPIVVSDIDHKRLMDLADVAGGRLAAAADTLYAEMERAEVVAASSIPTDVVQMGSIVEFRSDTGEQRRVTLVYPDEADIAASKISILTPIGAALIGLKVGQSIKWAARDGHEHLLTVEQVVQNVR